MDDGIVRNVPQAPTALFFRYNTALGPPYHVLLDTNFINFSIKNKLDIVRAGMDCLLAKVIPCVTECVLAELEKLGPKYRVALRIAKDPRFERIPCEHRGTYADDCLVHRVTEVRCCVSVDLSLQKGAPLHGTLTTRHVLPTTHFSIPQHRCYIVATCDRDLKRRLRKVPGVPIMYISQRKFTVERMPGAPRSSRATK